MKDSISSTEGSKKWQITLAKIFNWCFLIAIFLILVCSILFISKDKKLIQFNRAFIIGIIILVIIIGTYLLYSTALFFNKKSHNWNRRLQFINIIIIILLSIFITFTVEINYQVLDPQNCIKTAMELSKTMNWHDIPYGNIHHGYYYALIRCYNLAPFIYFQALIFKFCSIIGIKLTFSGMVTLGIYTNTIMLLISMYLAFKLVKRHCKISTQTFFTFLLLLNLPLYATVNYVYTDIPALLAVMIILFSYDSLMTTSNLKNKLFFSIIIIMTSIIGALLKFNVLIALFAILIHYLLTHNWKHSIKFLLLLLIPTILGINGVKKMITITSPVPQSELGLPATNWVNMSFSRTDINGGFNEEYFKHTFRLKHKYQNNNKVAQIEFKEFIRNLIAHPKKILYIIYQKLGSTYKGDFNYGVVEKYLVHPNLKYTILGQLLYGRYMSLLIYGSTVLQYCLFIIIGLGILLSIKQKKYISMITPWMLTIFGNMFLLIFWENHSRYLLSITELIYMLACIGIERFIDKKHNLLGK